MIATADGQKLKQRHFRANTWELLQILNYYRIILSGLLVTLIYFDATSSLLGKVAPQLFYLASHTLLALSIIFYVMTGIRWRSPDLQVQLQISTDIIMMVILVYASGGVDSGLSLLLLVTVIAGSIITTSKIGIYFAAMAAISLLFQEFYGSMRVEPITPNYVRAGVFGLIYFVSAIISHRVSRYLQATEELAEQRGLDLANLEQLNEYIIQHMQSGVIVIDQQDQVRLMNQAAWLLCGMPEENEAQSLETISQPLAKSVHQWRENPTLNPEKIQASNGKQELIPRYMKLVSKKHHGTLIFLDDTAELNQQAQAIKVASLGRLTASIAHEIRNPLGAISHASQLLAEAHGLSKHDQRLTEIIKNQSSRLNTIIKNVLQLSKSENHCTEEIPLTPWIAKFTRELPANLDIKEENIGFSIHPADTRIFANPDQLYQILFNLCENASHYGKNNQGELVLLIQGGYSKDLNSFYLDIIDQGAGILPADAQQIFEPFFTTGATGTGLGLYIASELCQKNIARLSYVPVPTGGSCFRIQFFSRPVSKSG